MNKILAFSGSSRNGSFNTKLVQIAAKSAKQTGADITIIDLIDYDMPIFNEDLEAKQGMPAKAKEFKRLLIEHDGFLIASPEYNSAFSPLLKNAIDWASRKESPDEKPLLAYQDKVAVIMAAAAGGLGGTRGLVFLRMLLGNLGVIVLPNQEGIPMAYQAFNEDGTLIDEVQQTAISNLGIKLAKTLQRLS
ncbi:MAG: NAD(P)H-dependent oxidoreductase [Candidatus Marithrix sp.]